MNEPNVTRDPAEILGAIQERAEMILKLEERRNPSTSADHAERIIELCEEMTSAILERQLRESVSIKAAPTTTGKSEICASCGLSLADYQHHRCPPSFSGAVGEAEKRLAEYKSADPEMYRNE